VRSETPGSPREGWSSLCLMNDELWRGLLDLSLTEFRQVCDADDAGTRAAHYELPETDPAVAVCCSDWILIMSSWVTGSEPVAK
jgi:hypothetical protein